MNYNNPNNQQVQKNSQEYALQQQMQNFQLAQGQIPPMNPNFQQQVTYNYKFEQYENNPTQPFQQQNMQINYQVQGHGFNDNFKNLDQRMKDFQFDQMDIDFDKKFKEQNDRFKQQQEEMLKQMNIPWTNPDLQLQSNLNFTPINPSNSLLQADKNYLGQPFENSSFNKQFNVQFNQYPEKQNMELNNQKPTTDFINPDFKSIPFQHQPQENKVYQNFNNNQVDIKPHNIDSLSHQVPNVMNQQFNYQSPNNFSANNNNAVPTNFKQHQFDKFQEPIKKNQDISNEFFIPNKQESHPVTQFGKQLENQNMMNLKQVEEKQQVNTEEQIKLLLGQNQQGNKTQDQQQAFDDLLNSRAKESQQKIQIQNSNIPSNIPFPNNQEKSKFQKRLNHLQQLQQQFTDEKFPPNSKSLFKYPEEYDEMKPIFDLPNLVNIQWKRAKDIPKLYGNGKMKLFLEKIEANDIKQGQIGDCYFLSSLAAIAEYENRIKQMFINQQINKQSCYGIRLTWNGCPKEVTIDDYFPVNILNNSLLFAQPNGSELWVILLEKAWAKIHRAYSFIDAQIGRDALHDLTGAPARTFRIGGQFMQTKQERDQLWQMLSEYDKKKYIMTISSKGSSEGVDKRTGLVFGHQYTLVSAVNSQLKVGGMITTERLVKIRNPWGEQEWNGKWGDKDSTWNKLSQSTIQKLDFKLENDGIFHMCFDDFFNQFESVDICYYKDNYVNSGIKQLYDLKNSEGLFFKIAIQHNGDYYFNVSQKSYRFYYNELTPKRPRPSMSQYYASVIFVLADSQMNVIQSWKGIGRDLTSFNYVDHPFNFSPGQYYAYIKLDWLNPPQQQKQNKVGISAYGPSEISITELLGMEKSQFMNKVVIKVQNRQLQINEQVKYLV